MKNRYARNPDVSASARVYVSPYRWPGILHDGTSVKVASNLFELIAIICAYSVLIFDGQRASNAATLYK